MSLTPTVMMGRRGDESHDSVIDVESNEGVNDCDNLELNAADLV